MVTDALDNEIIPGDIIIYNLGGELAVGKVVRFVPRKLYGRNIVEIEAQNLHSTGWDHPNKNISKIRNSNSVIRMKSLREYYNWSL